MVVPQYSRSPQIVYLRPQLDEEIEYLVLDYPELASVG